MNLKISPHNMHHQQTNHNMITKNIQKNKLNFNRNNLTKT